MLCRKTCKQAMHHKNKSHQERIKGLKDNGKGTFIFAMYSTLPLAFAHFRNTSAYAFLGRQGGQPNSTVQARI